MSLSPGNFEHLIAVFELRSNPERRQLAVCFSSLVSRISVDKISESSSRVVGFTIGYEASDDTKDNWK